MKAKPGSPYERAKRYMETDSFYALPDTRAKARALIACVEALEHVSKVIVDLEGGGVTVDLEEAPVAKERIRAALALAKGKTDE